MPEMAKRLLLNLLVDVLGNYVEGLSADNLKLGVWSGKIELHNLKLKKTALDMLNLPISISHGSLKCLKLQIPWTALESKPVCVYLDGIYLQAGPLDLSKMNPGDIKVSMLARKQKTLQDIEENAYKLLSSDSGSEKRVEQLSYIQQLTVKIIDNLEVTLTNIHIRYEDSKTIPGQIFSAGIVISSITLATTDGSWKEAFVTRDKEDCKAHKAVHKLGKMERFGIYWNTSSMQLEYLRSSEWEEAMQRLVTDHAATCQYLLRPYTGLSVKLTHNEHSSAHDPKLDCVLVSSRMELTVDKVQYQQLLATSSAFGQLDRQRTIAALRPTQRPDKAAAEWWRYAVTLVLQRGDCPRSGDKMIMMLKCLRARRSYMDLVKTARQVRGEHSQATPSPAQAKEQLLRESHIALIDDELPACALGVFRQLAVRELLQELKEKEALARVAAANKKSAFSWSSASSPVPSSPVRSAPPASTSTPASSSTASSMMSSLFSWSKSSGNTTTTPAQTRKPQQNTTQDSTHTQPYTPTREEAHEADNDEEEDNRLFEGLQHQLAAAAAVEEEEFTLRLLVTSSAVLTVTTEHAMLAEARMGVSASGEVKAGGITLSVACNDIAVRDLCTKAPLCHYLMRHKMTAAAPAVLLSDNSPCEFYVMFQTRQDKSKLLITSQPLEFTWNEQCIGRLLNIVLAQSSATSPQVISKLSKLTLDATSSAAALSLEVDVQIPAPKIIVPLHACEDRGCVLLDCGQLTVSGWLQPQGINLSVQLGCVNAAILDSQLQRSDAVNQYLIKPFDISVTCQDVDKVVANMTVKVLISPRLQGEIDLHRYQILDGVIACVTRTFESCKAASAVVGGDVQRMRHPAQPVAEDIPLIDTETPADLTRKLLDVAVEIPEVAMTVIVNSGHTLDFQAINFIVTATQRRLDSQLVIRLSDCSLTDSLRPKHLAALLWTSRDKSAKHALSDFIELTLVTVSSRQSPLFCGFGLTCAVSVADINIGLDELALTRLVPFVSELAAHVLRESSVTVAAQSVLSDNAAMSAVRQSSGPCGMSFTCAVHCVSLVLYQVCAGAGLRPAFSAEVVQLSGEMDRDSLEVAKAAIRLHTVNLIDCREVSVHNTHKSLLCRTEDSTAIESSNNYVLNISYAEESKYHAVVRVNLVDVTSYLYLDAIKSLTAVLLTLIEGGVRLSDAWTVPGVPVGDKIRRSSIQLSDSLDNLQITDKSASQLDEEHQVAEDGHDEIALTGFLLNVVVKANPCIYFLENPKSIDSQSIVSKCIVHVHYSTDLKNKLTGEVKESLHVSLTGSELFVLPGPGLSLRQIVDPFGVEFHINQFKERSMLISSAVSMAVDEVFTKVSCRDLSLAFAILQTANAQTAAVDLESRVEDRASTSQSIVAGTGAEMLTMFDVSVQAHKLTIVIINDLGDMNMPFLRSEIRNAEFTASGAASQLSGAGSVVCSVDCYNSRVALWEPVAECWRPEMTFACRPSGLTVDISNQTLQLNVWGNMLRTCAQLSQIVRSISSGVHSREGGYSGSQLSFVNTLGVPVQVLEHTSAAVLVSLEGAELRAVAVQQFSTSSDTSRIQQIVLPAYYDLRVMLDDRLPLTRLPLHTCHARAYSLQPKTQQAPSQVTAQPIVEEVFENARYAPLRRKWEKPWTSLNDPSEWTDVSCKGDRHPDNIKLPSDRWEWVEAAWEVCLAGQIGVEIDEHGWEYATNFNAFSMSKRRRCHQPMDVVRRRRWKRTRRPQRLAGEETSSLTVLWHVALGQDGTRVVTLSSPLTIENKLPYAVMCRLVSADVTKPSMELGPVAENEVMHVPLLLQARTSMVQFKPVALACDWCCSLSCVVRASERNALVDYCQHTRVTCAALTCDVQPLFAVARLSVQGKSLAVTLLSSLILHNRLPCPVLYRCVSSDGMHKQHSVLAADSQCRVVQVDSLSRPQLSLQLGTNLWSNSLILDQAGQFTVESLSPSNELGGLNLSISVSINSSGTMNVFIYSKFALVDRTGLLLSVRSARRVTCDAGRRLDIEVAEHCERMTYGDVLGTDSASSWAEGANGLVLFHAGDDTAAIGVNKGTAWSVPIPLVAIGTGKTPIEVIDTTTNTIYLLAFSLTVMPGNMHATQVLTVMPCYCVVNCTQQQLCVRQPGSSVVTSLGAQSSTGWHMTDQAADTLVQLRCADSAWSVGTLNLNDIGTTVLMLPNESSSNRAEGMCVLHVEVRMADACDWAHIIVTVWQESTTTQRDRDRLALSVKNNIDFPITLRQYFDDTNVSGLNLAQFEMCYNAGEWLPFGWASPSADNLVLVCLGTCAAAASEHSVIIDISKVGAQDVMDLSSSVGGRVLLTVRAEGSGRVLAITKGEDISDVSAVLAPREFLLRVQLNSLGVSVIAERPVRREFFSLYVEGIEAKLHLEDDKCASVTSSTTVELKVMDMQMDNYSETVVYPVMLHTFDAKERKQAMQQRERQQRQARLSHATRRSSMASASSASDHTPSEDNLPPALPFLELTAVKETPRDSVTPLFKYIACRVLEIRLSLDSSSLQLLMLDIVNDWTDIDFGMTTDRCAPDMSDISAYNTKMLADFGCELINTEKALAKAQEFKVHIESLVLHPVKITLSFMTSNFPRDKQFDVFSSKQFRHVKMIRGIAGVDELVVKLNSFIVSNASESQGSLMNRVLCKTQRELQTQLVQIAGRVFMSLNFLGRPVGLYRNIGSGVQDFFYEPMLGAMHSPEGFVLGVGRGTGSLIHGVVSGALSSTAAIVGSTSSAVAKGATMLSGDKDFGRKREEKRREQAASGGGVMAGLKAGGESVFSGFASGFSGLVTKPLEEGRKTGAAGFIKGVGLGLVGAAVKPIMGVSDGIASVAQGLTNQIGSTEHVQVSQARPCRAFDNSPVDEAERVLVTLDLAAAAAQQIIVTAARRDNSSDVFRTYVALGDNNQAGSTDVSAVIVSDMFLTALSAAGTVMWRLPFGDISHCVQLADFNTVRLVVYRGGRHEHLDITVRSKLCCDKLYCTLARYALKMGNPALVQQLQTEAAQDTQVDSEGDDHSLKSAAATAQYQFGTANHLRFPAVVCRHGKDVLDRARYRLGAPLPAQDQETFLRTLDERVMQLVCEWRTNHNNLRASRCCALVIMNATTSPVQLLHCELLEGRDLVTLPVRCLDATAGDCCGYDEETRCIAASGGAVVIFAYGYLPTLVDLAHVKLKVHSTAFTAQVSTRSNRSHCEPTGGLTVGYLEKSVTEWWAKYCVIAR